MTLDQLKVFVAVAERQHLTHAARDLNLAQSAASHAISTLEDEFQVKLFDRVGRRIELTAAGQLLLEEARGILARAATARLKMSELGDVQRGTLHVHASQTIASYWLPRYLVTYRQRYPLVDVQMAIGNTDDVVRGLNDGAAELGFIEGTTEIRRSLRIRSRVINWYSSSRRPIPGQAGETFAPLIFPRVSG
jgi:DNA-binding transcriptional LysR family regulator